jgi:hypothetical protein
MVDELTTRKICEVVVEAKKRHSSYDFFVVTLREENEKCLLYIVPVVIKKVEDVELHTDKSLLWYALAKCHELINEETIPKDLKRAIDKSQIELRHINSKYKISNIKVDFVDFQTKEKYVFDVKVCNNRLFEC